jgi:cyclic pyranopterin phosphate synthase
MAYTLINAKPAARPASEALPAALAAGQGALVDSFGRRVSYLRLSITDRCDLRCTYCMPVRMTFLPR